GGRATDEAGDARPRLVSERNRADTAGDHPGGQDDAIDGAGLCPAESLREVQGTLPGFLSDRVDGAGLCPAQSSREVQGTLPGFLSDRSQGSHARSSSAPTSQRPPMDEVFKNWPARPTCPHPTVSWGTGA